MRAAGCRPMRCRYTDTKHVTADTSSGHLYSANARISPDGPPYRIEFPTILRLKGRGSTYKPTGRWFSWNDLARLNPLAVRAPPPLDEFVKSGGTVGQGERGEQADAKVAKVSKNAARKECREDDGWIGTGSAESIYAPRVADPQPLGSMPESVNASISNSVGAKGGKRLFERLGMGGPDSFGPLSGDGPGAKPEIPSAPSSSSRRRASRGADPTRPTEPPPKSSSAQADDISLPSTPLKKRTAPDGDGGSEAAPSNPSTPVARSHVPPSGLGLGLTPDTHATRHATSSNPSTSSPARSPAPVVAELAPPRSPGPPRSASPASGQIDALLERLRLAKTNLGSSASMWAPTTPAVASTSGSNTASPSKTVPSVSQSVEKTETAPRETVRTELISAPPKDTAAPSAPTSKTIQSSSSSAPGAESERRAPLSATSPARERSTRRQRGKIHHEKEKEKTENEDGKEDEGERKHADMQVAEEVYSRSGAPVPSAAAQISASAASPLSKHKPVPSEVSKEPPVPVLAATPTCKVSEPATAPSPSSTTPQDQTGLSPEVEQSKEGRRGSRKRGRRISNANVAVGASAGTGAAPSQGPTVNGESAGMAGVPDAPEPRYKETQHTISAPASEVIRAPTGAAAAIGGLVDIRPSGAEDAPHEELPVPSATTGGGAPDEAPTTAASRLATSVSESIVTDSALPPKSSLQGDTEEAEPQSHPIERAASPHRAESHIDWAEDDGEGDDTLPDLDDWGISSLPGSSSAAALSSLSKGNGGTEKTTSFPSSRSAPMLSSLATRKEDERSGEAARSLRAGQRNGDEHEHDSQETGHQGGKKSKRGGRNRKKAGRGEGEEPAMDVETSHRAQGRSNGDVVLAQASSPPKAPLGIRIAGRAAASQSNGNGAGGSGAVVSMSEASSVPPTAPRKELLNGTSHSMHAPSPSAAPAAPALAKQQQLWTANAPPTGPKAMRSAAAAAAGARAEANGHAPPVGGGRSREAGRGWNGPGVSHPSSMSNNSSVGAVENGNGRSTRRERPHARPRIAATDGGTFARLAKGIVVGPPASGSAAGAGSTPGRPRAADASSGGRERK